MTRTTGATSNRLHPLLWSLCGALGAAILLPAPAAAQRPDPSVEIHLEYFRPSFDSSVRLDSEELGIGTNLDLEGDLAMEKDTGALRANLLFRPGRRARINLDYHAFDRSGSAVVGRQVRFGGTTFRADAQLDSTLESRFVAGGFGYALVAQPDAEFGLSLSVAWVELDATLRGLAVIPGGPPLVIEERGKTSGPVPMLGVFGGWWFGDRFRLTGDARYFQISNFDDWEGSALDLGVRFDWFVIDNVALGVGYGRTDIEAKSKKARDLGRADYAYDGFRAGVTFAF